MRFTTSILAILVLLVFAAYAIAPIFGLDDLYPHIFNDNALNWQLGIVVIVVLGAVYWLNGRRAGNKNDE